MPAPPAFSRVNLLTACSQSARKTGCALRRGVLEAEVMLGNVDCGALFPLDSFTVPRAWPSGANALRGFGWAAPIRRIIASAGFTPTGASNASRAENAMSAPPPRPAFGGRLTDGGSRPALLTSRYLADEMETIQDAKKKIGTPSPSLSGSGKSFFRCSSVRLERSCNGWAVSTKRRRK